MKGSTYIRDMETKQIKQEINKVDDVKKREKSVSLTAEQIREISKNEKLGEIIANQIDDSEGNLKGNMAFGIAKAMIKQLKLL